MAALDRAGRRTDANATSRSLPQDIQYATPEEIAQWLGAPAELGSARDIPVMARPSDERLRLPVLLEARDPAGCEPF